jgi:peptidoglycan hydrolase-like protein with peptidoglycan-binding domain
LKLEPLPPAGPYKPTAEEIQTALKNAGYYNGAIDGKLGPMSKKAIEEFQKANGLQVDGKVGPKTWLALSSHLNPPVETPAATKATTGKTKR